MKSQVKESEQDYEQEALRINAAQNAYIKVYSTMHPPPVKPEFNWYSVGIKALATVLGLIGAIIVSGSHSIPIFIGVDSIQDIEWGRGMFVGFASFSMVEIMIVVFAFSAIEFSNNADSLKHVKRNTSIGKWSLAFAIAVFNIYYVLISNGIDIPDVIRIGIFVVIGLSAPVIAFLTGEIWAIDNIKRRAISTRLTAEYEAAYEQWLEGLNNKWNANKKKWGGQVSIQVQAVSDEYQLPETVSNGSKQLDKGQTLNQKAAVQYILANESEYEIHVKTVLEQNPTANKRIVAESIAMLMTGESRGYMTVIRAYKKLGKELL